MIEMAFGLSFQAEYSMIANNFVTAQLDAEEYSEQPFANEQERLAMTRVLHDYKTAYETNGRIASDLEKQFNQLGSIFKPEVESPEEDSLQAAMMAQARIQPKPVHQDKGNYRGPKKKQDTKQGTHRSPRMETLRQNQQPVPRRRSRGVRPVSSPLVRDRATLLAQALGWVLSVDAVASETNSLLSLFFARYAEPRAEVEDSFAVGDWDRSLSVPLLWALPPRGSLRVSPHGPSQPLRGQGSC
jgi:hypothetical protein